MNSQASKRLRSIKGSFKTHLNLVAEDPLSPSAISNKKNIISLNGPFSMTNSAAPTIEVNKSVFSRKSKKSKTRYSNAHMKVMEQMKHISHIRDDLVLDGDFHFDV